MGMTDKQFAAYIRRLMAEIRETIEAETVEEKNRRLEKLLEEFQKDIEDLCPPC